jgi:enterochelin esterase-like enzyme
MSFAVRGARPGSRYPRRIARTEIDVDAPTLDNGLITFRYGDPEGTVARVWLCQEVARPRVGPEFERVDDGLFELQWPRPDVGRLEYMIRVLHADGREEQGRDPANPRTAPGAFGDKSVLEFPDYAPPEWVEREPEAGEVVETSLRSPVLRGDVPALVWSSAGSEPGEPLPLLVAHDGPEYAAYSSLLRWLDCMVADGRVPPMRAALLPPPGDRNQLYSASATYARALAHDVLPSLAAIAPTPPGRRARVGMGASLGALAMLHVHRAAPASFGALFLQSGSFFRQRFDKQESGFVRFRRISRFVGTVLIASDWMHPIPVTLSCGTIEENLANNRAVRRALREQGYETRFQGNRDGHNWIGWRDVFDPHLTDLLSRTWS